MLAEFFEVGVAPVVAGFLDETLGFCEMLAGLVTVVVCEGRAGRGKVVVSQMKSHAGPSGDSEDFFEVVGLAASQEGERKVFQLPGTTEDVDSLVEVICGLS